MAKSTQNSTNINLPIYNAFDSLDDERDKLYVEMAVFGYSYRIIAYKARRKYQTVKTWFMTGGRLHEAYKAQLEEQKADYAKNFKQIRELIKEGAFYAVLKLIEAVRAEGIWPAQIMAARDLLSRAGFNPVEKATTTVKTDEEVVVAVKKFQELIKQIVEKNGSS